MKHQQQQIFSKTPDTVMRMFRDHAFFERKYALLGLRDAQVTDYEQQGDNVRVRVRYTSQSDVPLPDFARKLVSGDIQVEQEESWDLVRGVGRIEVTLVGLPFKIEADTKLTAYNQNGAVNTQNWDIRCAIPLVGVQLEKLMLDDIRSKAAADGAAAHRLLDEY
ncbi:MAG: DUF2505 domain-containing protein [Perlucidibaca sp.]